MRIQDGQWRQVDKGLGVLTFNHEFIGNTIFKEVSGTSLLLPISRIWLDACSTSDSESSANLLRAMLVNRAEATNEVALTFSKQIQDDYKKNKIPTTAKWREMSLATA